MLFRSEGIDDLLAAVERALMSGRPTITVDLSAEQLSEAPWIYENAEVLERSDDPETGRSQFRIRLPEQRLTAFKDWARRVGVAADGSA